MSDVKYTRTDVRCQVIRLAKSLSTVYGIKEGDVIGIFCENRLEFPVIVFAAFCLGATVAPLNATYTDRKCLFFLTHVYCVDEMTRLHASLIMYSRLHSFLFNCDFTNFFLFALCATFIFIQVSLIML